MDARLKDLFNEAWAARAALVEPWQAVSKWERALAKWDRAVKLGRAHTREAKGKAWATRAKAANVKAWSAYGEAEAAVKTKMAEAEAEAGKVWAAYAEALQEQQQALQEKKQVWDALQAFAKARTSHDRKVWVAYRKEMEAVKKRAVVEAARRADEVALEAEADTKQLSFTYVEGLQEAKAAALEVAWVDKESAGKRAVVEAAREALEAALEAAYAERMWAYAQAERKKAALEAEAIWVETEAWKWPTGMYTWKEGKEGKAEWDRWLAKVRAEKDTALDRARVAKVRATDVTLEPKVWALLPRGLAMKEETKAAWAEAEAAWAEARKSQQRRAWAKAGNAWHDAETKAQRERDKWRTGKSFWNSWESTANWAGARAKEVVWKALEYTEGEGVEGVLWEG